MLTEAEVRRTFSKLMSNPDAEPDAFEKAEVLLDELRPESPLRLRLMEELDEIRQARAVS